MNGRTVHTLPHDADATVDAQDSVIPAGSRRSGPETCATTVRGARGWSHVFGRAWGLGVVPPRKKGCSMYYSYMSVGFAYRCVTHHTHGMLGRKVAINAAAHRRCSGEAALVHAVSTAAA